MSETTRKYPKMRALMVTVSVGVLGSTGSALGQSSTPGTTPEGQPIAASGMLVNIIEEARRVCLPITNGQFTLITPLGFHEPKSPVRS